MTPREQRIAELTAARDRLDDQIRRLTGHLTNPTPTPSPLAWMPAADLVCDLAGDAHCWTTHVAPLITATKRARRAAA